MSESKNRQETGIFTDEIKKYSVAAADPMEYFPGMEQISPAVMEEVLQQREAFAEEDYTADDVQRALTNTSLTPNDFKALLSSAALPFLEDIAKAAQKLRQ